MHSTLNGLPEVRADRIATLYFFRPVQRFLRRASAGIPILMYHRISRDKEAGRRAYYKTCTDPTVFREQMAFLVGNGYETIGLEEAVRRLDGTTTQSKQKLVVLTFDDAYGDFYTEAFPVLSRLGYTATVFLPTEHIGETARIFNGTACLTWSQVRELWSAGIGFGSHTVTHPQLTTLRRAGVWEELRRSKQEIEDRLSAPIESFSYPYAFPEADFMFKQRLSDILTATGYKNGVSTIIGTASPQSDHFFLARLPVNSDDDLALFRAKLEGAYDWLHSIQYTTKRLRSMLASAPSEFEDHLGSNGAGFRG